MRNPCYAALILSAGLTMFPTGPIGPATAQTYEDQDPTGALQPKGEIRRIQPQGVDRAGGSTSMGTGSGRKVSRPLRREEPARESTVRRHFTPSIRHRPE